MLSRAIKMAFWITYDHLGKLILANLMWSISFFVPLMLGFAAFTAGDRAIAVAVGVPLTLLALCVILPVATAGMAHFVKELIDTRDGSLRDLFTGIRLYWKRAIGLGSFFAFAPFCLATSIWFYSAKLGATVPWLGYAISALALWCLLFVALMAMLVMPALVQKKEGVFPTLKLAALLVMDNPIFCLGLAVQFVVIAGLSMIVPILVFLSCSIAVVLSSSAYEMLARKYAKRARAEATPIQGMTRATAALIEDEDAKDDYLNRGFRDFLFPWKE